MQKITSEHKHCKMYELTGGGALTHCLMSGLCLRVQRCWSQSVLYGFYSLFRLIQVVHSVRLKVLLRHWWHKS